MQAPNESDGRKKPKKVKILSEQFGKMTKN
jgi:hypothetical protein